MGKKIVVLNGSPRKNGNTAALIEAFKEGAEGAGNAVSTFFLEGMNIRGCKGCYGGGKDPESPCVQKDDMDKIYPAYREADVIVLASPLYFWDVSGQLKIAFDRLFAVAESAPGYRNPPKQAALIMAAEGADFEPAVKHYLEILSFLKWEDIGQVLAGNVNMPGDIDGKPALEEARK
ncbi:flavodoxin family protein, partial [Synergistaceae bacterium OttesenSCG-928-I11]|nr:flavodoxin family protein [Synergistaceae bacterium OttesenSCG-928-I11]